MAGAGWSFIPAAAIGVASTKPGPSSRTPESTGVPATDAPTAAVAAAATRTPAHAASAASAVADAATNVRAAAPGARLHRSADGSVASVSLSTDGHVASVPDAIGRPAAAVGCLATLALPADYATAAIAAERLPHIAAGSSR